MKDMKQKAREREEPERRREMTLASPDPVASSPIFNISC